MKTGIVDVGGGLRGIFAAGVFDYCMDNAITFDLVIGVSAGSANAASFLAGQRGRNYTFYTEYAFEKDYMGLHNMLAKHSYVDLDYVYSTLSNTGGRCPLDYPALIENPAELLVAATNALTGSVKYFDKSNLAQDHYHIFKASSALPFFCKPYTVDWIPYYDGALADPVPVAKAFACGCDKVVVVLTRPADRPRGPGKDSFFANRIQRKYPFAAKKLRTRVQRYNESVELARQYEAEGKALIIAPDDICGLETLTRDKPALLRFYQKGYHAAEQIREFLTDTGSAIE